MTGGAQFRLPNSFPTAQAEGCRGGSVPCLPIARPCCCGASPVRAKRKFTCTFAAEGSGPGRTSAAAACRRSARTAQLVDRLRQVFGERGDRLSFETQPTASVPGALPPPAGLCGRRAGDRGPFGDLPAAAPPGAGRGGRGTRSQLQTEPTRRPATRARDCARADAARLLGCRTLLGKRYCVAGELFKRCDRKIAAAWYWRERYGPSRMPQIPRVRYDPCRETRRAALPISNKLLLENQYGGDPRRRRSGDAFPEPAGFRTLCRVPGVWLERPAVRIVM